MTDRLDRLESLADTILLAIQAQQTQIVDLKELIISDSQNLVTLITILAEQAIEDRAVIREIQSEVRGLQTENRCILERWEQQ